MIEADQRLPSAAQVDSRPGRAWFHSAAEALAWDGLAIPDIHLFGYRVTVFAELDGEVHARRQADGWSPVIDRTTVAMWSWPENQRNAPAPAVRVKGVIASGDRWQRTVKIASRFNGFGSTAIITESGRPPTERCLLTAQFYGVGVVWHSPRASLRLASPGRVGPVPTARPTVVSRWVEELVYERALRTGLVKT